MAKRMREHVHKKVKHKNFYAKMLQTATDSLQRVYTKIHKELAAKNAEVWKSICMDIDVNVKLKKDADADESLKPSEESPVVAMFAKLLQELKNEHQRIVKDVKWIEV
jgi:hypothetical protein